MDSTVSLILFFATILILAGVVFAFIAITKKDSKQLNVDKFRSLWLDIESKLDRDDPSTFQLCIMNADSLVDKALKEKGTPGKTMGERLKQVESSCTKINSLWAAHKIRNQLAHEPDRIRLNYDITKKALSAYKQALKDLGAI